MTKTLAIILLFFSISQFIYAQQDKGMGKLVNVTAPAGTERRVALVIGNNDYLHIKDLKNPLNDAEDMSKALKELGFEVIQINNADYKSFFTKLETFKRSLTNSDIAFFYYSGHGAGYHGQTYLLPTDADIRCLEQIEFQGVSLNRILGEITAKKVKNSFVILDACRNIPDIKICEDTKKELFTNVGLVKPTNNPQGSIIIYATEEGQTADDNIHARNGLFTSSFLKYLTIPNLSIRTILDKTSIDVLKQSNNSQSPARYEKIYGDFYFVLKGKEDPSPVIKRVTPEVEKPLVLTSTELYQQGELAFQKKDYVEARAYYVEAVNAGNSDAMNSLGYMSQVGLGVSEDIKQAKIWYERAYNLSNPKAAYNLGFIYEYGVEVNIGKAKEYYRKSCDWGDVSGCERVQILSESVPPLVTSTKKYLDLPFAEMAYIPGGSFEMGDTRNEGEVDEKPKHTVKLDGFYMGKYEVTQRQWESIMGSNPSYFKDCPDCPIERVSWGDVQEFLKKLNSRTGSNYRLPTEAEWEYAAGGGSNNRTRFGNGMDILKSSGANFDATDVKPYSQLGEYRGKTIKVGSFKSNDLGMYDMTGNVLEWCSDWYEADYYASSGSMNPSGPSRGASRALRDGGIWDGSVPSKDSFQVLRGGSWSDYPQYCRVAARSYMSLNRRRDDIGFRVVLSQ